MILYKRATRAVFVYGFAKKERANIPQDELATLKELAAEILTYDDTALAQAVAMPWPRRDGPSLCMPAPACIAAPQIFHRHETLFSPLPLHRVPSRKGSKVVVILSSRARIRKARSRVDTAPSGQMSGCRNTPRWCRALR
jgi:RelE toxin of RelE / RelB toxin-antitoxin system